jgi:O-antigen ligase
VALGVAAGLALGRVSLPSTAVVVAGGLGLLAVTALALLRYEAAVALGFVLLGVVTTDPAPPDAVFGVVIAIALVTGRLDATRVPPSVLGLIAALIGLNLASAIGPVDASEAVGFFSITLYLAVFAIWLTGYVDSRRRARSVVLAYGAGAVLVALVASLALIGPFPFPGRDVLLLQGCCRATGFFQDPNVFGPFLVPAILILVDELVAPKLLSRARALTVAALLVLVLGVLLSFSRGAWLNLAVGIVVTLLVLALRRGAGRRLARVVAILALCVGLTLVVVAATGSLEFLGQRASFQAYDTERFAAQRTGADLAAHYPLGVGPGQFEAHAPIAAHSMYVRVLAEQGPLGLGVLVSLMLVTLALAGRNAATGRDSFGVGSAALLGAWCGLVVNGFFIDTLHWRHLWLVAALVWVGTVRASTAGER